MTPPDTQTQLARIVDLLSRNDFTSAKRAAQFFTAQHSDIAHGWFLLGAARHRLGELNPALADFKRADALHPDHPQVLSATGAVLSQLGRHEDALAACQKSHALDPGNAEKIANVGVVFDALGRLAEALAWYDRAMAVNPAEFSALLNRGAVLSRLGRPQDALAANKLLAERYPDMADAWYNLSESLLLLHAYDAAHQACEQGLSAAPRHARLVMNRALSLAAMAHFSDAQAELARAQTLAPDLLSRLLPATGKNPKNSVDTYACAELVYFEAMTRAQRDGQWKDRDGFLFNLDRFIEDGTPSGIPLHSQALATSVLASPMRPAQRLRLLRQISEYAMDSAWLYEMPPLRHALRERQRIRIAYVSPDFRDHPIGHLTGSLYRLHDRERFEVYCYSLLAIDDPVQAGIAADCDHWRDISALDNVAAAGRIHDDGIDILIDMAGYTAHARPELFALRPAPIQAHYLGYPGSMGADFMDYAIVDAFVCPPEQQQHLAEFPVVLPNASCPYDDETPNTPALIARAAVGLPEHCFVFCYSGATASIAPDIFDCWMRLLQQLPESVLWLVSAQAIEVANLRREAEARGIGGDRLIAGEPLQRQQYLPRLQLADLFLDTPRHSAQAAAADALWQGLPVLACVGEAWSARLAGSLLNALGLDEMVTETLQDYELRALQLATQPDVLAAVRRKLEQAKLQAPVFDTARTVRHLEQAFQVMWSRWCRAEPADKIVIAPSPSVNTP